MDREKLHRLLRLGIEKGASDIHFQVGYLPLYRFNGELVELRYKVLSASDTEAIARMLRRGRRAPTSTIDFNELDLAYELPNEGRFRVNISRQRRCFNVVLRVIPPQIRTFEELNLPTVLRDLAQMRRGYVLITGATGMGKSTTLATMIEEVNRVRKAKIVTIEDPIEFVFKHDKSIITQREIGTDTADFPDALHAALRQDPDVIMVGEMRDLKTVDTSLKAAETGHMVFSSIHTSDVSSTVNRLVSFFPTEEQLAVRARLADNLRAIVSLRLLPEQEADRARAGRRAHALDPQHPGVHQGSRARPTRSTTSSRKGRPREHADLRPAPARPAARQQDLGGDGAGGRLQSDRLPDQAGPRRRRSRRGGDAGSDQRSDGDRVGRALLGRGSSACAPNSADRPKTLAAALRSAASRAADAASGGLALVFAAGGDAARPAPARGVGLRRGRRRPRRRRRRAAARARRRALGRRARRRRTSRRSARAPRAAW